MIVGTNVALVKWKNTSFSPGLSNTHFYKHGKEDDKHFLTKINVLFLMDLSASNITTHTGRIHNARLDSKDAVHDMFTEIVNIWYFGNTLHAYILQI
jgi:hypothetical protein